MSDPQNLELLELTAPPFRTVTTVVPSNIRRDAEHFALAVRDTFGARNRTVPPEVMAVFNDDHPAWPDLLDWYFPLDATLTWGRGGRREVLLRLGAENLLSLRAGEYEEVLFDVDDWADLCAEPHLPLFNARSYRPMTPLPAVRWSILAALAVVLVAETADGEVRLMTSWRDLVARPVPPASVVDRRAGYVAVTVLPPSLGRSRDHYADPEPPVEVALVLASKARKGGFNQPRKVHRDGMKLLDTLEGASATEVAIMQAFDLYTANAAKSPGRSAIAAQRTEATKSARARCFSALIGHPHVQFEGHPISVQAEPWAGMLAVTDHPDGLSVRLTSIPDALWSEGDGWALVGDTMRPLAPGQLQLLLRLSVLGDLRVPEAEIGAFLDQVLPDPAMPLRLDTTRLPMLDEAVEPRLLLAQTEEGLHVSHGWRYRGVDVPANHVGHVRVAGGIAARDFAAEGALTGELTRVLGAAPPHTLKADDGFDFLADAVPQLDGWIIEADRRLLKRRGMVRAKVSVESKQDWFDLGVAFESDGVSVPVKAVLAAWRQRRRYVELADGTVARLPEVWLSQHAESVDDLSRRKKNERLGAVGAVVFSDLLAEAGEAARASADAAAIAAAAEAQRWLDIALRLRSFEGLRARPAPPGLQADLRPYQLGGLRWLAGLADHGLGGVLADDMGLGKTLQTLALLLESGGPALVAAPTSVVGNWLDEAQRFAPSLRVVVWHGPDRGPLPALGSFDVLVTSHTLLRIEADVLLPVRWKVAVLDEAQAIKNADSALAQVARKIEAEARFALTGTPMENHLFELWSLFAFAVPGLLGSREVFRERFAKPIQDGDDDALNALRHRIRPFLLRRLKGEVASELPPRVDQIVTVDLTPDQRRLYQHLRDAYRENVLKAVQEKGPGGAAIEVFEALTRLRQACCHPQLVPLPQAQAILESAKLDTLMEMLDEAIDGGHRSLVFSQWPSFLAYVRKALDARGVPYLYLDGQTTRRAHLQAQWNAADGPPVFLISIKAGGTGLNLTAADHVFHLDPWWNPAVEQQATDRAHRIGQNRTVFVYKLVARDTVEDKVLALQADKRALFEATVDEGRLVNAQLSAQDIRALFDTGGEVVPFAPAAAKQAAKTTQQPTESIDHFSERRQAVPGPPAHGPAADMKAPKSKAKTKPKAPVAPPAQAEVPNEAPAAPAASNRPAKPSGPAAVSVSRAVPPAHAAASPKEAATTPRHLGVEPLPEVIQDLLDSGHVLTNASVRQALGLDAQHSGRALAQWVLDGHLAAHGTGRGRYYERPAT